jgi:hypothetical protein
MSRRDYILIARALRAARTIRVDANGNSRPNTQWLACATCVSHALGCDNPRFDAARFLTACGAAE